MSSGGVPRGVVKLFRRRGPCGVDLLKVRKTRPMSNRRFFVAISMRARARL